MLWLISLKLESAVRKPQIKNYHNLHFQECLKYVEKMLLPLEFKNIFEIRKYIWTKNFEQSQLYSPNFLIRPIMN